MAEKKDIVVGIRIDPTGAEAGAKQVEKSLVGVEKELKKVNDTPLSLGDRMAKIKTEIDSGSLSMRDYSKRIMEYQSIALEAGRTSPIGKEAIQQAAALQDRVTDLRNEVTRLSKDGQAMQGALAIGSTVTAGYGAMQGVMALAGQENEALMKSLVKMQAAQSVLMGIESIRAALEKESVLMTTVKNVQTKILTASTFLYSAAVGTATGALKLFKLALAATGIGALIVGIGLLIANFESVSKWVVSVSKTIADIFKPQIDMVIKALQFLGLVDSEETKKIKKNAQEKRDAIKKQTESIISDLNRQSEANRKATDEAVNGIDYEIRKRQAAGEDTRELEREKIMILIDSTKTELALIDQRIAAKQTEMEQANFYNKEILKIQTKSYEALQNLQKDNLNSLIQDLEIFDIGERKRAMDEIARKKTTSNKKIKVVKEEISEEEKLRIAAEQREAQRILDQIAFEEKVTEEYNLRQLSKQQLEEQQLNERYERERLAFADNQEMLLRIKEEYETQQAEIEKRFKDERDARADDENKKRIQLETDVQDAKLGLASEGFNVAGQLMDAFQSNSEKGARRAFQIQKGISIAQATIDTYKGATAIFASAAANPSSILFPAQPFITAGLAIGSGLANVAKISRQQFSGGGGGGGGSVLIPRVSSGGANGGASGQNQQNDNLTNIASLLNNQAAPVLVVDSFNKVNSEAEKIKTVSSI